MIEYIISDPLKPALLLAGYASVNHAARTLGVCQSAVSRRVQALEHKLGASLSERHPAPLFFTSECSPRAGRC
ncbi:MAG: LysR family transcriptional regulator [Methylocystis sp.]